MSHPWMPFYVADYLADTGHLSAAEHGAYLLLIMHYWQRRVLPNDDRLLARIARMSDREWRASKPVLAALFGDGWTHSRIDSELEKADKKSEARAECGSRGGTNKALKNKNQPVAIATELPSKSNRFALASSSQSHSQSDNLGSTPSSSVLPTDDDRIDFEEAKRRCEQAHGRPLTHFDAIEDLLRSGVDLESRILPVIRDMTAVQRLKQFESPGSWRYFVKEIRLRDEGGEPEKTAPVAVEFVEIDSPKWSLICRVRKESMLRALLKKHNGSEGVWFPTREIPSVQQPAGA